MSKGDFELRKRFDDTERIMKSRYCIERLAYSPTFAKRFLARCEPVRRLKDWMLYRNGESLTLYFITMIIRYGAIYDEIEDNDPTSTTYLHCSCEI